MAEYIERVAAEKELMYAMAGTGYQSRAIDAIKFMPTADVVEVVRCKNCTYSNEDGTRCHYGVGRDTEPMGYCQNGVREDGKGEGE